MLKTLNIFCLILSVTLSAEAGERISAVGRYGFDWLKPESAKCHQIQAKEAALFKPCTAHSSGAFGLALPYLSCPEKKGGEVLAFDDQQKCQLALETMQANAP